MSMIERLSVDERKQLYKEMFYAYEKSLPVLITDVHVDEYYCPVCGAENNCDQGIVEDRYCPKCGQKLEVTP